MNKKYLLLPGGLTACFETACQIGEKETLKLGAYIPGISYLPKKPAHIDFTLTHKFSDQTSLSDHGHNVKLTTHKAKSLPEDVYHLFYGMQRRELITRGLYPIHAACVGNDKDFTLIVGHSGAGKTTLAQKLIDTQDLKLFSGNKTVVRFNEDGGLTAIAGTKTKTALDTNLNRFAYELEEDKYTLKNEVNISAINIIRINDGVEEAQEISPVSALHTLFPYFMDAVNADVIVNENDVLDGYTNTSSKTLLTRSLANAISNIKVAKYAGSLDFLQRKVL